MNNGANDERAGIILTASPSFFVTRRCFVGKPSQTGWIG
jgi:hypothetical protein